MICVGIDVAKDKHDCFILNSEGEIPSRTAWKGSIACCKKSVPAFQALYRSIIPQQGAKVKFFSVFF